MTPAEVAALLGCTALFGSLDPDTLADVAERCAVRTFRRRQVIVTEGEAGDAMFVVASGTVQAFTSGDDGGRLVLVTLGPPEVFGEIALLDGGLRSASIEASETTTLVILRRDTLLALLAGGRAIADAMLRYLGGMIRRLTEQSADLAFLDLPGRVAKLLSTLASQRGTPAAGGTVLDLPLTQSDIAAMVGGSRQSVNQVLRALERRGDLEMRDGSIVLRAPLQPGH